MMAVKAGSELDLHIIEYKGRKSIHSATSHNFTISLSGEASRTGFLLQPQVSKFNTNSADSIQLGIKSLRPDDEDLQQAHQPHPASLILELRAIYLRKQ